MTGRTRSARPRRRCREVATTLVLILLVLAVSVIAYAVEQAGLLDVRVAGAVETGSTSSTPPGTGHTASAIGPEPSASEASVDDLERSYELLRKESGRLKSVIEERGSRRGDATAARLDWPAEGDVVISSGFGPRAHPVLRRKLVHEGIDLALVLSSPVKAAAGGEVIYTSDLEIHGTTLVIDHGNGLATVYCHLSRALVKEGATVWSGEVVGESGMTGLATGPHLHFEVRVDGEPQDPMDFLPDPAAS